jgi:preprotein translocase subunit SecG
MIAIASVLLILAVLVQAPKSGMAANFGAANQTMGVRQTSDFLEKFTWAMVAAIVLFTLLSVTAIPSKEVEQKAFNPIEESKATTEVEETATLEIPADGAAVEAEGEEAAAEQTTEAPAETPAE